MELNTTNDTFESLWSRRCMDRTDSEQVFGDMVNTFQVIPNDRKESEVCLGESVLPCRNVTSSFCWPVMNKLMSDSYAVNLRSVRPRLTNGWRDFKQTGFKVFKSFHVAHNGRPREPQRTLKKQ